MPEPSRPEALLSQVKWVHALARRLLRDEHLAEDVAQSALLAAWRQQPRRAGAWLNRVVRNLAASSLRGRERRERRERQAGRAGPCRRTPGPADELAVRAETSRQVVDAVLALEAPYRDVLLLRYYDELSAAEIARRLGQPAGTVRSRLKRARDQLRARLDRDYGGRGAWCVAAVAMLGLPRGPVAAVATGGAVLGIKSKALVVVALLALTLLTVGVAQQLGGGPAPGPRSARRAADARRAAVATLPVAGETPAGGGGEGVVAAARVALSGRVIGHDGAGVAGASVVALDAPFSARATTEALAFMEFLAREPRVIAETVSGAGGGFDLVVPRGARLALRASAEGYGPAELANLPLGGGGAGIELRLTWPATLRGRVLDETGGPVAGASVRIWRQKGAALEHDVTGADGGFLLDSLAPGECDLVVRHPDFVDTRFPERTVPDRDLVLRLPTGETLAGVVLDAGSGKPVPDAVISVFGFTLRGGPLPIHTRTDAHGRYALAGVPRLGLFSFLADGGGAGRVMAQNVTWRDRWMVERILLGPTLTVPGRVVDEAGEPVGGVPLRIYDEHTGYGGGHHAAVSADEDGLFRIEGVGGSPGPPTVIPGSEWIHTRSSPEWDQWLEDPGQEFRVIVARAPRVDGVVHDEEGALLPGVLVHARRAGSALTDAQGRFSLRARPGSVRLRAQREGYRPQEATVLDLTAGEVRGGVRIGMTRHVEPPPEQAGFITGSAVEEGGSPLGGIEVVAYHVQHFAAGAMSRNRMGAAHTAKDGSFRIDNLPPGKKLRVVASGRGFESQGVEGILPGEAGTAVPVFVFAPELTLRGRVVDGKGRPVPGVGVQAEKWDSQHRVRERLTTDFEGRFELRGAVRGTWKVRCGQLEFEVDLPQSGELRIEFPHRDERTGGLAIEGEVLDVDGRPCPAAFVSAIPVAGGGREPAPPFYSPQGLDGRFRVMHLPPGRYRLEARWTSFREGSRRAAQVFPAVEAEAGATGVVVRARWGATIAGEVVGVAPDGLTVSARSESGSGSSRADVGPDGRFELTGLQPGAYRLELRGDAAYADPLPGVSTGSKDAVFRAVPTLEIVGRVLLDGEPCGQRVRIGIFSLGENEYRKWAEAEPDGSFRVGGLRGGRYRLRFHSSAPKRVREIDVEAGAGEVLVDLAPPDR